MKRLCQSIKNLYCVWYKGMIEKMGKKSKATLLTMIFSVLSSIILMLLNLVYNNFLISIYGSNVNGLISTLTQFVSLFTVLEGGFTTAAIVSVYKPIVDKDYNSLNDILYTAKMTFGKVGLIISLCVLVLGSGYIFMIDSVLSYRDTYILLLISVLSTSLSICALSKYNILLQGDNKEYKLIQINTLCKMIVWIVSIVLILRRCNILIVYFLNVINILLSVIILKYYVNRKYKMITYRGKYNKKLILGTGDVFFQKIANSIFTSTDLILISAFIGLAASSVYNLYYQFFSSILSFLVSIIQAPFNSIGQMVNTEAEKNKVNSFFMIYQHFALMLTTFFLTVTGAIIIPFIKIYTRNISDCNYIDYGLVLLFFTQIFVQIVNRPFGILLNATGNFKMQNKQCFWAAIVNLGVSYVALKRYGTHGIVFGSFCGTLIILVMNIYQTYKNILKESSMRNCINIILNYILGISLIILSFYLMKDREIGYIEWGLYSGCVCVIFGIIILIFNEVIFCSGTNKVVKFIKSML